MRQRRDFNEGTNSWISMKFSSGFSGFAVSSPVFRQVTLCTHGDSFIERCIFCMEKLQKFISYTYWCPGSDIDGKECADFVSGRYRGNFIDELRLFSKEYVKSGEKLWSESELARKHLEKPNLHRLTELYEISVPTLLHFREFMELVFEIRHQPLKRCIARSNNKNAHIVAVERCLLNDWQG